MKWYLLRRLGASLLTLFLASVVVFAGIRGLPGGPAVALSSETASPAVLAAIRAEYGLNKPLPVQYADWIGQIFHGNFGQSATSGVPVSSELGSRIPVTLELAVFALLIAIVIGIPAGLAAAAKRDTPVDYSATSASVLGLSVPHFWLGILFILLFAVKLGWLPASGFVPFLSDPLGNLARMIMPAFVLGIGIAAVVTRQLRSAMLESLGADYIRTARAKGLGEGVVIGVHALRNSLLTVVTVIGLQLGLLISGVVVTEQIFVIAGLGRLTLDAVFSRDYPTLEGVVLLTATGYIVVNFLTDITYSLLNPRIRVAGGAQ